MKKIIKNLIFAAVLFFAAGTALIYAYANYTECRCNQATPGPSVTIATCCSAQYGGYGTSNGDSRCCSSPKYWLSNFHNCYTPCSSVNCSGSTPTKNPSASYDEISPTTGAPSGTGNCCMAGASGTVKINSVVANGIASSSVYSYGFTPGSDCTTSANLNNYSGCQAYANSLKNNYKQCATNPTSGAACDPSTFQTCYPSYATVIVNLYSSSDAPPLGTGGASWTGLCGVQGNNTYNCSQSAQRFDCTNGCSGQTCCDTGGNCMTVGGPTTPQKCYVWQCLCSATLTNLATCS